MHQSSFNIMSQFRSLVEKHFHGRTIKVLDIGSLGVNGTYREIFSDPSLFSYTGLDLTPGPNVDYIAADPYSWNGIADESCDVVISGQAFEHIEFPWLVMEEISRKLKTGGMACIVAPSRGPEHKYPVDCWRYYPDGFIALAKWAGLEVLESKTCWGQTGFQDGSDQWGDTFCILYKRGDTKAVQKLHNAAPDSLPARNSNKNSPLIMSKDTSYYDFERNDVIDFINENRLAPKRVLEIGCARGATGRKLKQIFDIAYYVGVELSPDEARFARQHLDTVIVADIEKECLTSHGIKYADFDTVIALDVLEHLYDPWTTVAELKRYLRPGGHIIASIPNIQNITILKNLSRGSWHYCDSGILDATHIRFFTQESIGALFTGSGMSLKKFKCVLNPVIDLDTIKDSGNRVEDKNFVLSGLDKKEMIRLFTYQYLVSAQNNGALAVEKSDLPFSLAAGVRKGLVSIVILTFNQLGYTRKCVESIRDNTPEKHEIIFVDNNSSDGTLTWLRKIVKANPNYKLLENRANLGFAKGCNQGIRAASGEYILLLNNDVLVSRDWLSGLLECLNSSHNTGIVGPMTNNISGLQRVPDAVYDQNDFSAYASSFRLRMRHRRMPLRRIVGFCMLFRRELVEKVGFLDESFGTGNFEDDDFCLRASLAGCMNLIAGDVFIHHFGSRTFIGNNIPYNASLAANRAIFNKKWNDRSLSSDLRKDLLMMNKCEMAEELFQKLEIDKAIKVLVECIAIKPERTDIYFRIARMLIDSECFDEALATLDTMEEKTSPGDHWMMLAGLAKLGKEIYDEALSFAEKVLAVNPDSAVALNLKGRIAQVGHENELARNCYKKAIIADASLGISYSNLGVLAWGEGLKKEAIELFEKGFLLSPMVSECISLYHAAINSEELFEQAEGLVRAIAGLYPVSKKLTFFLIDILVKQRKYQQAIEEIQKVMAIYGTDDGILAAALNIRNHLGPLSIDNEERKGSLSVCMIVKDEEDKIARCLLSILPIASEIIVVDTGSSDRTKDIARVFGAHVFDFGWVNDFSAARNCSMSQAKGEWILIHDADEIISPRDYEKLRLALHDTSAGAYSLITRNYSTDSVCEGWTMNKGEYPDEETGTGWSPSPKVRLVRNDDRFRFENPVHELLEPSLRRAHIEIRHLPVTIHHYGQTDGERITAKGEMYYEIGRKKLEEMPDQEAALRELAVQARALGKYGESVDLWKKYILINPGHPRPYFNMSGCYYETEDYAKAFETAKKALELDPACKETIQCFGIMSLFNDNTSQAIALLEDMLKVTPEYPTGKMTLAAAYSLAGRENESLDQLKQLKEMKYDCSIALCAIAQKLIRANKKSEGLNLLQNMEKSGHINADGIELLGQALRN